ncbi:MAG: YfiR family protein [Thermodesulfobacteriota bacterium]
MATRHRKAAGPIAIGLVLLLAAGHPLPASGHHTPIHEYEVKAAFLYNFTKFVTWNWSVPSRDAEEPFVIGVVGENPFGDALALLERKTVRGRPIVVRNVETLESLRSCRMAFVSSSEESRLPAILQGAHARNILTVGDMDRFAARGGVIGLVMRGDRVGFEINVDAARRAGLTVSSKLLSLAAAVHRDEGR